MDSVFHNNRKNMDELELTLDGLSSNSMPWLQRRGETFIKALKVILKFLPWAIDPPWRDTRKFVPWASQHRRAPLRAPDRPDRLKLMYFFYQHRFRRPLLKLCFS